MTCFSPITAFIILNQYTESGKKLILFNDNDVKGLPYQSIKLPCSQCIGCRIDKVRDWAIRIVHEAQTWDDNCFLTLTYNDEHINRYGSLRKLDIQNFMKNIRRKFYGTRAFTYNGKTSFPIRFFQCGEYGETCKKCGLSKNKCKCGKFEKGLGRPHHHVVLFNYNFPDLQYAETKKGHRWYVSETLAKIWTKGFHSIGDVTPGTAAYVAKYATKKITGEKANEHYKKINPATGEIYYIEPEYITMSRRPGIGGQWFKEFKKDVYPKDFITADGKIFRTPRYYDKLYDEIYPMELEAVKQKRRKEAYENQNENTMSRLKAKHAVRLGQQKLYERSYECC